MSSLAEGSFVNSKKLSRYCLITVCKLIGTTVLQLWGSRKQISDLPQQLI